MIVIELLSRGKQEIYRRLRGERVITFKACLVTMVWSRSLSNSLLWYHFIESTMSFIDHLFAIVAATTHAYAPITCQTKSLTHLEI